MIRGIRGATTVEHNEKDEILTATRLLLEDMIRYNQLIREDICSVFISVTADLNAVFPAQSLRMIEGLKYVPVMCMQEIPVPNSLPRCIRVMIHAETTKNQKEVKHIYHKRAKQLRPDLNSEREESR
ncbi:chorismate mutase [Melghiribacillus thermohalophilus]|uniref:chorismate mutase n=1 Tax=Melghiribacillus thermohalophilus TaxID=1324956 RepID=A0A4R3N886_9BACI|nr:chorismate mutase [Melghiribacillus thermohalophilus]TCT25573.1 chorismate mutase [Melghiribacillus thermohalophilus]